MVDELAPGARTRPKGLGRQATETAASAARKTVALFLSLVRTLAQSYCDRNEKRARSAIRTWAKRHRDRQELLNLLDQDHRIARDMGATDHELRAWAQKPFWLP